MTHGRRIAVAAVLVVGCGGALAVTAGVTRSQAPVPPSVGRGTTDVARAARHAGVYWAGLTGVEKEAFVSGFLAGALSEQVRAIAVAEHRQADSASVRSAVEDSLRMSHGVRFPFAPAVYTSQLDDFYWWTNHATTPVVDALVQINAQLVGQQATR
jgi:hypothetical protein